MLTVNSTVAGILQHWEGMLQERWDLTVSPPFAKYSDGNRERAERYFETYLILGDALEESGHLPEAAAVRWLAEKKVLLFSLAPDLHGKGAAIWVYTFWHKDGFQRAVGDLPDKVFIRMRKMCKRKEIGGSNYGDAAIDFCTLKDVIVAVTATLQSLGMI